MCSWVLVISRCFRFHCSYSYPARSVSGRKIRQDTSPLAFCLRNRGSLVSCGRRRAGVRSPGLRTLVKVCSGVSFFRSYRRYRAVNGHIPERPGGKSEIQEQHVHFGVRAVAPASVVFPVNPAIVV